MAGGTILSLDLATEAGWCFGAPGERPRSGAFRLAGEGASPAERYVGLMRWLYEHLPVLRPYRVLYEAPLPYGARQGKMSADSGTFLMRLGGIVELSCQLKGVYRVGTGNVQDVRQHFIGGHSFTYHGKAITGRRNLRSAEAKFCVGERCRALGFSPATSDEADAIALWFWASAKVAPETAHRTTPLLEEAFA